MKNLENVQGDERDVILFSTAFSVNSRGVLPLNFGPLNRAGGERRLNVAITRARRQVIVFSSFEPAQLRAEETSSVGVKHLRAYLDLAQQGPRALGPLPAGQRLRTTDRHREEIAESLRQRGFHVQTEVGLSDFTIDLVVGAAESARRTGAGGPAGRPGLGGPPDGRRPGRSAGRGAVQADALAGGGAGLAAGMARRRRRRAGPTGRRRSRRRPRHRMQRRTRPLAVQGLAADATAGPRTSPVKPPAPAADLDAEPGTAPPATGTAAETGGAAAATSAGLPGESPFTPWHPGDLGTRDVLDGLPAAGCGSPGQHGPGRRGGGRGAH